MGNKNSKRKKRTEFEDKIDPAPTHKIVSNPVDTINPTVVANIANNDTNGNIDDTAATDIGIVDKDKFKKIVYFWFLTTLETTQAMNMDIDDLLINLAYNYYFYVDMVLLRYYHYDHSWNEFDSRAAKGGERRSYLWLVHSNGNVYHIEDCHGFQHSIKTSSMDEYVNDKYLQKDKCLSPAQCDKLISILLELQINGIAQWELSEGPGDCQEQWHIIMHCGKDLAAIYGVDSKQYTSWKQVDFNALIEFCENELKIEAGHIKHYFSKEQLKYYSEMNYGFDEVEISIDHHNNCLMFHEEEMYS